VPVNFGQLRHPKRDMVWVALAGPGSNMIQAILWAIGFVVLAGSGVTETFFLGMCKAGVLVNLVMAAFNLFPLPPLDGGRVLTGLLPRQLAYSFSRIEPYGFFIVMALVIMNVVGDYWLRPLIALGYLGIDFLLTPLTALFR
jgi:Zn-dependent protease